MARILIVEDDPMLRDIFATALRYAGHGVLEARDGEEALWCARENQPDLILLDFSIPKLDGIACLEILKSDPATERIAVVAVTAHGEIEYRIRASVAGCDGFLAKPADTAEIIDAVNALVDARREPRRTGI